MHIARKSNGRISLAALLVSIFVTSGLVGLSLRRSREDRLVFYSDTASDTLISSLNRSGWPFVFHIEETITDPSLRMADYSKDHFLRLQALYAARKTPPESASSFFHPSCLVIPVDEFLDVYPEVLTRQEVQARLECVGRATPYRGPATSWYLGYFVADMAIWLAAAVGGAALAEMIVRKHRLKENVR